MATRKSFPSCSWRLTSLLTCHRNQHCFWQLLHSDLTEHVDDLGRVVFGVRANMKQHIRSASAGSLTVAAYPEYRFIERTWQKFEQIPIPSLLEFKPLLPQFIKRSDAAHSQLIARKMAGQISRHQRPLMAVQCIQPHELGGVEVYQRHPDRSVANLE